MKKDDIYSIVDLIFKSWRMKLNDSERDRFEELMKQEDWRQLKNNLEDDQFVVEHLHMYERYVETANFSSFLDKAKERKKKLNRKLWMSWACAASVFLGGIGVLCYCIPSSDEVAGVSPLASGVFQKGDVRLIMPDNKTIDLTDGVEYKELDSLGVSVVKGTRVLNYMNVAKDGGASAELQYHTLCVPAGQIYKLILSDGSQVVLNAETTIKYPVCFKGDQRAVFVDGEAYFDVVKNPDVPFVVFGNNYSLKVLGTTFNVMGYDDDAVSKITLLTGSIFLNVQDSSFYVKPGEQVFFARDHRMDVCRVDGNASIAWMDNKFSFENEKLENVLRKICRWYGVDVTYEAVSLRDRCFTGTPPNDIPLQELLDVLSRVTDIKFTLRKGVIRVSCLE